MLAHLKASATMSAQNEDQDPSQEDSRETSACAGVDETQMMTCDALCSLGTTEQSQERNYESPGSNEECLMEAAQQKMGKQCPKQLQLPMFLSKTYHMIDRCPGDVAIWSENGENFVVKNVEKFASNVLPLYFKHSNFSSFARQLNFYGFRKLRTDPILTSDVDPRTACYVRFYHEKFQKGKPELLHQIKRATKTDQQSKDDVESLKSEVCKLKDTLRATTADNERKMEALSVECNRRISHVTAECEKLAALVHHAIAGVHLAGAVSPLSAPQETVAPAGTLSAPDLLQSLSRVAAVSLQNHLQPTLPNAKRSAEPGSTAAPQAARSRKS